MRNHTSPSRSDRARRRRRARRRLVVLLVVLVVAVAAVAAVLVLRARGEESPAQAAPGGSSVLATPAASPSATVTPAPEVWLASKADPVRVWIGGDSMGGELGWALGPLLDDAKVFKPTTFYKESSGICRYDFFNWQKRIESVMRTVRPQAAVIMMGTNDTQSVWKGGAWIAYGEMAWKKAYEQRVGDIMDTMLDGGARRVYWVGMPIMGESWRNSRMRLINRVFQKQAEQRPGVEYVDIWELFADADGSYDASLRLADQVHFTGEGQALLAKTVFKALRADWFPPGSGATNTASPSPSASAL